MNVIKNTPSKGTIELVIELERFDIEQDLARAARHLSEHLEIPGFRKGTAPYDVVCRHVGGESKVYEEALQGAVSRTLGRAVADEKLETVGMPEVSIQKMAPPFGVAYTAVFSLMPEVSLGDISKIIVAKKDASATEEEVQKVIAHLREMRAQEAAVDQPAKKGDKVVIDLEIKRGGVAIEHGVSKKFPLILGEGRLIPGFEDALIGLKAGDKKTFELTFPKEYFEKSLAGKPAEFSIVVQQVFERTLPELNDEFAQALGHAQTTKELEKQIRENLQFEKEREERERFEMAAMDELVKISTVGELSERMIADETRTMLHELEESIVQRGGKMDDYLASINKSRADLEKEFRPAAEHRLKVSMVGRAFGQTEQVSVDEGDVEREIAAHKKAYQSRPEMAAQFERREYHEHIRNMLTSRKIFERLAEKVRTKNAA